MAALHTLHALGSHPVNVAGIWAGTPPTLAVLTAPRNGAEYIDDTLASLDAAGASMWPGPRFVVADDVGPFRFVIGSDYQKGWEWVFTGGRTGNVAATRTIFERAQGGDLLVFEDDVIACKNAVTAALSLKLPPYVSLVSFFRTSHRTPVMSRVRDGFHLAQFKKGFAGSQALFIPARTIDLILRRGLVSQRPDLCGRDSAIGIALDGMYYAQSEPSWYQHTGVVSSIHANNDTKKRDAREFRPDMDALVASKTLHIPRQLHKASLRELATAKRCHTCGEVFEPLPVSDRL